ncbi:MAG TPA: serine hydrolase domain-containing protein [Stellaceae bacterium]|nr:serine hydrolase domain-containing protein [Stellaceae bacterium]
MTVPLQPRAGRRVLGALLCCGALGLLLSACSDFASMEFDATGAEAMRYAQSGDLRAEVDAVARPLVAQGETPGIEVGILLPDGSMRFFGYGVADRDTGRAPDADTLFAVGSLSKGFLGTIADLLVREGRLSWNDTLGEVIPADAKPSRDARAITMLQLATHTSGLPRQPYTRPILLPFFRYLFTGESFYDPLDRDFMFDYLSGFSAPRAAEYEYSNIGYGLLGYAIETRTGQNLDTLLQRDIVAPLGLKETGYVPEDLPGYATRAHGYAGDQPKFIRRGAPVPDWTFTPLMRGSAALYSSARDLLIFARAHLAPPDTPLGRAMTDTLRVRLARPRESAAIAWTVDEVDGEEISYMLGVVAGYTSYLGLDVRHRIAVVVLRNSFSWDESIGGRLLVRLGRARDGSAGRFGR